MLLVYYIVLCAGYFKWFCIQNYVNLARPTQKTLRHFEKIIEILEPEYVIQKGETHYKSHNHY